MFVARDGSRASAFVDAMAFFAPEMEILRLPSWDCLPYDRVGPSPGVSAERMATLTRLARGRLRQEAGAAGHPAAGADAARCRRKAAVLAAGYAARVGDDVDLADLERYFAVNGYHRASTVSERGEFAIRGGVIDVFPPGADEPVRLDLFGDTLEIDPRLRPRDPALDPPAAKRSTCCRSARRCSTQTAIARFRNGYVAAFGAPGDDPLYATVSEGGRRAGIEHWLPLFYESWRPCSTICRPTP